MFKVAGQGWPWPDPGPTRLARGQADPGHGPAELGPTLRARVKGQEKGAGPGPARPLDSVVTNTSSQFTIQRTQFKNHNTRSTQ